MNSKTRALRVSGTIFRLMCIAQLLRFLAQIEMLVDGHQVPLRLSAVVVVVMGGLSSWVWTVSCSMGTQSSTGAS